MSQSKFRRVVCTLILLLLPLTGCAPREAPASAELLREVFQNFPEGYKIESLRLIKIQDGCYWIDAEFANDHAIYIVPLSELEVEGFVEGKTPLPMSLTVRMLYLRQGRIPGAVREPLNPDLFR